MAEINPVPSPCESCTTTKDPTSCANKSCNRYQTWFMKQWNFWAPFVLQKLKEREAENGQRA
ncbi:MAG: hypothetical protein J6Q53_04255 [Oscillospiraceae bacterium]|nr:hypothetical protein [Oscillospiraceae bacterium]